MANNRNNWFKSWFDTKYYHILYKHRNNEEASYFIRNLVEFLQIKNGSSVADIACGKGRHSLELSKYNLNVWGMDLSENSIHFAKEHSNSFTSFDVHDMREPFPKSDFHYIFNLFTSFGYFENAQEDQKCILNIYKSLLSQGLFIQDYLNAESVVGDFPLKEVKVIDGVQFEIEKLVYDGFIEKHIHVIDADYNESFMERVKIFTKNELVLLHENAGFEVRNEFGNYSLDSFDGTNSPRIILVSKKS